MPNHSSSPTLPKSPEAYWLESTKVASSESLQQDLEADVVVVGGGITGVAAAYLLSNEGVRVVLLEADRLLGGTTGHTTAKITAQHDLFYDELIQHFGQTKAKQYYDSNMEALQFIQSTIERLNIDCQFQPEDAYVYATTHRYAQLIEKEYDAYRLLGIPGTLTDTIPFDIDIKSAVIMKHQGQFHPLEFLTALINQMTKNGVQIYEKTTAIKVEENPDGRPSVITREGHTVRARKVLSCTHFPFCDLPGFYAARMYAERSYVLAGNMQGDYPGGMYITAENTPVRSLRSAKINSEPMVLVGGEGHRTGQGINTMEHYVALSTFGNDVLGMTEIRYRWSAQDLFTLDKVPYIGELTPMHSNVLVATGYKKWGMTTGIAAARLLCDLALERDNPYRELYTPSRFYADPSLKKFFSTNLNVAAHLIKGKLEMPSGDIDSLHPGESSAVVYEGERAGAYKDDEGNVFLVDTTCTHLGCEVQWNAGDKTWDCPCHGSRFSYQGDVVEGPAERPLKRYL